MRTSPRLCLALLLAMEACGGSLDAGADIHSGLPVDSRNPVLLVNDGPYDNWQGELAMLYASRGALSLVGMVVNTSPNYSKIEDNLTGWKNMVTAAREGGLRNIPDPIESIGPALVRPADGTIQSTVPNTSDGAALIVNTSKTVAHPWRPLVVLTGGRLTDVADAYLMDPGVAQRIVVVSSLGTATKDGAQMGRPNGEMDVWADTIVAQRLPYVQVSVSYDQTGDVPASLPPQLPPNAFTSWIKTKQAQILSDPKASDQVPVAVLAIPTFVSAWSKATQQGVDSSNLPLLANDPNGPVWLVSEVKGALLAASFWQMLLAKETYGTH